MRPKLSFFVLMFAFLFCGELSAQDGKEKLTLRECLDYGVANNLSVLGATLDVEGQKINVKQRKLDLAPSVNANVGLQTNWGRSVDQATYDYVNRRLVNNNAGVGANLVLFNGLRKMHALSQSKIDLQASELDLQKAENDVRLRIVSSFLSVMLRKELLKAAEFQVTSTDKRLERIVAMVKAGSRPRTAQLDLEAQLATQRVEVVRAQNDLRFAYLQLKQNMRVPANRNLEIVEPDLSVAGIALNQKNVEQVYEAAENTMPEVQSSDLGVESATYAVKQTLADFLPSLSISAGLGTRYSDQSDFSFGKQYDNNLNKNVGLTLSIPLFNGLSARAGKSRALIGKQRAELQAESVRNQLRQDIETAFNDAQAAYATHESAVKQVSSLEEAFKATEKRYELGASNFVDYQVAQNNLFRAKSDLLRAKYNYLFGVKMLDFYVGQSLAFE
ncbi:transporter [Fulvitalea axinellae]|uniref:Transporter n=1 Tax=Fulvitalea axinellae TaxID=1182444 RepID=A0AAU9D8Y3_9BACT|nr:transporter [Fulvitalea axinellae]